MKRLYGMLILVTILSFGGCIKDNSGNGNDPDMGVAKRTLFIYIAANNSLAGEAVSNLNLIRAGATMSMLNENRIVIYYARPSASPQLLELVYDKKIGAFNYKVLKEYPGQSAADIASYSGSIRDMKEFAPALKYALILWSHASGWLPVNTPREYLYLDVSLNRMSVGEDHSFIRDPFRDEIKTKVFGQDGSNWMEVHEVAAATPDNTFDFIIADCCLMGEAEVAYEFRNKTDYLIASPAEVISVGMPYDKILSDIFGGGDLVNRLKSLCLKYNDYYKYYANPSGSTSSWGKMNSATIALYDCSEMESLADQMALVVSSTRGAIPNMDMSGIQPYDRYTKHTKFDIRAVVETLLGTSNDALLNAFREQLDKTVIYKLTTGRMIKLMIDPQKYSGMGVYVPLNRYDDLNSFYFNSNWGKKIFSLN